MKTIPEDIREKLREPFPPEAISQHPTKTFLSTIKAIYITERLNDVFGIGGWNLQHVIVSDTPEYVTVCGFISLKEPYGFDTPRQYGGHKKTGTNTEPADGYKSAMTDCQSKCASYLEIGIDVFKGLVNPPKTGKKAVNDKPSNPPSPQTSEMSVKQWNFMKKIGMEDCGLSENDLIELVKWKAKDLNLAPRDKGVARAFLGSKDADPKEAFSAILLQWENATAEGNG